MHGYKMLELKHAGLFGCQTCRVLYYGIVHFVQKLGVEFEDWESEVRQETARDSKLLGESRLIQVELLADGEHTGYLEFTCDGKFEGLSVTFE